jgi:hypothetical protein
MKLAHAIEIALRLFGAFRHLALAGLGTMGLTDALGLDDLGASVHTAVPTGRCHGHQRVVRGL